MRGVRKFVTESGKEGNDLNDVIRGVLDELMETRAWSENRAAKALGITQRSFNRFMKGEHGLRVDSFSRLCAELEMNPVAFLQSHPLYDPGTRSKLRFAKDAVYERFRTTLANDEARDLTALVEEAKHLGVFDESMAGIRAAVAASKAARRKAIQESHGKKHSA